MIKLTIAYDGSRFNGSAIQPKTKTVQGEFEKVLKILGIESKSVFSGRTDKDVHSTNQIVSFEVPSFWDDDKRLLETLRHHLYGSIEIKKLERVSKEFHARFSAKKREYRYLISLKKTDPYLYHYVHFHENIDIQLLQKASQILIGVHDFKYFSKTGSDPKSTVREIYRIKIYKHKDLVVLKFEANSYLRSQIRMMVDFLLKISDKKLTLDQLQDQLDCKQMISKTLAPPFGLYLTKIRY